MKLLVSLFVLSFSIFANAGIIIISDFDDTIKRSNIPNLRGGGVPARALGNVVLWKKIYIGMPMVLKAMEKKSDGLYVLSASPAMIKPLIKLTLKSSNIRYKKLFTRSFLGLEDKEKYKINRIESVLQNPDDKLILLGDNVEVDAEIFTRVADSNDGRVEQIYIHRVLDVANLEGIKYYYTAYEVAAHEYLAGRLALDRVQKVAAKILKTSYKRFYKIITNYSYCPKDSNDFTAIKSEKLAQLNEAVQNKVLKYCNMRFID